MVHAIGEPAHRAGLINKNMKHTNLTNEITGSYHNSEDISSWVFYPTVYLSTFALIAILGWVFGVTDQFIETAGGFIYNIRN